MVWKGVVIEKSLGNMGPIGLAKIAGRGAQRLKARLKKAALGCSLWK